MHSSNFSLGAYGYSGQNLSQDGCLDISDYILNDHNSSGNPDLEQLSRNSERPFTIHDIKSDIFEYSPCLELGPDWPEITDPTFDPFFDRGYCTFTGENSYVFGLCT